MADIIDINVNKTVEDVTINVTEEVIQVNINTVNGGGGVESVTGTAVDNTDPLNPIVNNAVDSVNSQTGVVSIDLESVLTEGNVANTLPIKVSDVQIYDTETLDYGKFEVFDKILTYTNSNGNPFIAFDGSSTDFLTFFGFNNTENRGITVPNESGDMQLSILKTANFTAISGQGYRVNGTLTITDPSSSVNNYFFALVIGGSVTIGGVAYTSGALVYRYYDGASWISKNYNQDLQSVLTNSGTVIEGDNELYLNVIDGELDWSAVGSVSSPSFRATADQDVVIANVNNSTNKQAGVIIDTDGNLELIQKNATNTFGTGITITEPTANRSIVFKNESGTVAYTSDIPSPITIDATPTDGSSNAVSSNGVFDALALKVSVNKYIKGNRVILGGLSGVQVFDSILIPANTYKSGDGFSILANLDKIASANNITLSLSHDTVINGLTNTIANNVVFSINQLSATFIRYILIDGTTARCLSSVNNSGGFPLFTTQANASFAFDPTVDNYITFSASLIVSNSITLNAFIITPI